MLAERSFWTWHGNSSVFHVTLHLTVLSVQVFIKSILSVYNAGFWHLNLCMLNASRLCFSLQVYLFTPTVWHLGCWLFSVERKKKGGEIACRIPSLPFSTENRVLCSGGPSIMCNVIKSLLSFKLWVITFLPPPTSIILPYVCHFIQFLVKTLPLCLLNVLLFQPTSLFCQDYFESYSWFLEN